MEATFKHLNFADMYLISILKDVETDEQGFNDNWETDSEHVTPLETLKRCAGLVNSGVPEYHIRISAFDYDEDCLGGISFHDSINYEEELS